MNITGPAKPWIDARPAAISEGERQIIALLTEIRDALMAPTEPPPCPHPEDRRRDMSSMGEVEWICKDCLFHYGPVTKGKVDAAIPQSPVGA